MPNISINGWPVPVATASMAPYEIGEAKNAFSGRQRRQRLAVKREWSFVTVPLPYDDALAYKYMLQNRGQYFPFDIDAYSSKGLWPATSSANIVVSNSPTKFGAGSLACQVSATNLLTSNQATGTDTTSDTTGFSIGNSNTYNNSTAGSSTITSSTDVAWQGSRSLKAVFANDAFYAVRTMSISLSASTQYCFSFYAQGPVTIVLSAVDQFNHGLMDSGQGGSFVVPSGTWTRYTAHFTTNSDTTAVQLFIQQTAMAAHTFYIDGMMLNVGATAVAWADGTFPGLNLSYGIGRDTSDSVQAITMNAWVNAAKGTIMALTNSNNSHSQLLLGYTTASSIGLYLNTIDDFGVVSTTSYLNYSPSTWDMLTMIVQPWPPAGMSSVRGYHNGNLIINANPSRLPSLNGLDTLQIGNLYGSFQMSGFLDEALFLPFAASANMLSILYSATAPFGAQPQLTATGDFFQGESVTVVSHDVSVDVGEENSSAGAWQNNMGTLHFSLTEV